ncbi:MAG TPA: response regulator transcription factor [bacterium]|nr:response regulator transcription factor [bacterium]
METGKATVLLVDSQPIVRHGVAALINGSKHFKIAGEAGNSAQALESAARLQPRIVLIELLLDDVITVDLIPKILEKSPRSGILIFSNRNDAMFAHRAMRAGANGYLLKQEAPAQILTALRRVLEGKTYLSPQILKRMLYYYGEDKKAGSDDQFCKLSDRELQIFRLIGSGLNIRQIAEKLSLERKTIDTYCSRIKKKLDIETLSELTREAIRWSPEL